MLNNLNYFSTNEDVTAKTNFMHDIEVILSKHGSTEKTLISTPHKLYIEKFLLMYIIYIKEIIFSKLSQLNVESKKTRIGYAVSIEKLLLNNVIGTKEDFQDLIFISGLVQKNDSFNKLRVITQGEVILPTIQKYLKLKLPLKSYFLLFQLHQDYIQLTLNQVVTNSEKEEQEAIILCDEIVHILNIYDSMCLIMWNNLIQDSSLIQVCDVHNRDIGNKVSDILSLKTKIEFMANFKICIADNVRY